MEHVLLRGEPDIEVALRRSAQARRLSLRVSRRTGVVALSMPRRVAYRVAQEFIEQKEPWIRKHLSQRPEILSVGQGVSIPVEGQPHMVHLQPGRKILQSQDVLHIPSDRPGPRLAAWLKGLARDRLAAASDLYAAKLGVGYGTISMRDTTSRWGSCSSAGNLNYSWRLIMAPPAVLSYVAAHEVAHRLEMNHSDRFWAHVARAMPEFKTHQAWLKTHGEALHRVDFS